MELIRSFEEYVGEEMVSKIEECWNFEGGGQESKNDIRRRAFWGRFLKKKGKERARCKLGISGCVGVGPEGVCVRDDGVCVWYYTYLGVPPVPTFRQVSLSSPRLLGGAQRMGSISQVLTSMCGRNDASRPSCSSFLFFLLPDHAG